MKIQHVPVEFVQQTLPLVEELLRPAFELSPLSDEFELGHLKLYVSQGQHVLLVWTDTDNFIHAAATIQWHNFPNHRTAFITAIGGTDVFTPDSLASLDAWVRANGGTKIQGVVRDSVARLCRQKAGYSKVYTTVEKLL